MKCSEKKFEDFRFLHFHLERKCYLLRLEKKNKLKKKKKGLFETDRSSTLDIISLYSYRHPDGNINSAGGDVT